MNQRHAYWICQIGGWTAYSVSRIALGSFFQDMTWGPVLMNLVLGGAGLLYTHLYRVAIHRRDWTRMSLRQLAPRVILASFFVAVLLHGTVDSIGRYLLELNFYDEIDSELGVFLASIVNGWILIMLWSLIYFGVHYFWNYRQAEVDKWKLKAQAETARLKALKLQLNPHFFFNSLNSVRALIAEDPSRAQRMVTRLARLLRKTLQVDDVKTVPLEEELSTVRTYLELEKVRFRNRLQYDINVDEEVLDRSVPFMLVQTLVENGIKHGIATRSDGGTLTVEADENEDVLRLRVTNPGTLESEDGGTGLDNARERLHLLFGPDASLTVANADADTVVACARLPTRVDPDGPSVGASADSSDVFLS